MDYKIIRAENEEINLKMIKKINLTSRRRRRTSIPNFLRIHRVSERKELLKIK